MTESEDLSLAQAVLAAAASATAGRSLLSREGVAALAEALRSFGPFEHVGWVLADEKAARILLLPTERTATLLLPWDHLAAGTLAAEHEVARMAAADNASGPARAVRDAGCEHVLLVPMQASGNTIGWLVAAWRGAGRELASQRVAAIGLLGHALGPTLHHELTAASLAPPDLTPEQARQIVVAGRLASIGTLAGGVVHEINNPATFIALAAGQIEKGVSAGLAESDPARAASLIELTSGIQEATRQIRGLVGDFRQFVGGAGRSAMLTVDLERVLAAAAAMTRAAHRHDAILQTDIASIPPCPGNLLAIGPATVNVLVNSIEALGHGPGVQRVSLKALIQGESLVVVVADTGSGIRPEHLPRVYDPFFTTKSTERHAGLGLTVARSVMSNLGGTIGIQSEWGAGTTVTMTVPVA